VYDLVIYIVLEQEAAFIKRKEDNAYSQLNLDKLPEDIHTNKNILVIFESKQEVLRLTRAVLGKKFVDVCFKMLEKTSYTHLDIFNNVGGRNHTIIEKEVCSVIYNMCLGLKSYISKNIYERMTQGGTGERRIMLVNFVLARSFNRLVKEPATSFICFNCKVTKEDVPRSRAGLVRYTGFFRCSHAYKDMQDSRLARETHPEMSFIEIRQEDTDSRHSWLEHLRPNHAPLRCLHVDRTFISCPSEYRRVQSIAIAIENVIVDLYNEEKSSEVSLSRLLDDKTLQRSKITLEKQLFKVANVEAHITLKYFKHASLTPLWSCLKSCSHFRATGAAFRKAWR